MNWIDLGNPRPRARPASYTPLRWPQGEPVAVDGFRDSSGRQDFFEVVGRRRTCRAFAHSASNEILAMLDALLSVSCKAQVRGTDTLGFPLSLRPSASAGAIHPIHVVANVPGQEHWLRFDPFKGNLIGLSTKVRVDDVRSSLDAVLHAPDAALILFVAEPAMTATKYAEGASLIWRDAGVLQGTVAMTAEALGFGCTILGVTGEPWSSQLLDTPGLHGVGVAFVGKPSPGAYV